VFLSKNADHASAMAEEKEVNVIKNQAGIRNRQYNVHVF
jgi:hypothetical protein